MPWTTFSLTPSGGSQAEDAQLMTNDNNGNTILTLPSNVIITDVLTSTTLTETHQFAFQINGVKATSNAYSAIVNPASSGRMSWADMKLTVPSGNSIGISTGQTSAGAAEFIRLVIKYEPVQ